MSNYSLISPTAFDDLVLGAGIILKDFNLSAVQFSASDIICSTTDGVQISCKPNRIDLAEGAENILPGLIDFDYIQSWDGGMSFTSLNMTANGILLALGAGTVTSEAIDTITPVIGLSKDFARNLWWVGTRGDNGLAVVHLKSLISSGGLSIQTKDRQKAGVSVTLSSKGRIGDKEPPIIFYAIEPIRDSLVLIDPATNRYYGISVKNGDMYYTDIASGDAREAYKLIDTETGEIYAIGVENGDMYYQNNAEGISGEAKKVHLLRDADAGEIYKVQVENGRLYYQKGSNNG